VHDGSKPLPFRRLDAAATESVYDDWQLAPVIRTGNLTALPCNAVARLQVNKMKRERSELHSIARRLERVSGRIAEYEQDFCFLIRRYRRFTNALEPALLENTNGACIR